MGEGVEFLNVFPQSIFLKNYLELEKTRYPTAMSAVETVYRGKLKEMTPR